MNAWGAIKAEGTFDGRTPIESVIAEWLTRIYPGVAKGDIQQNWTGSIVRSSNGLPMFGRAPGTRHIIYGVGYSGNGVGPSMLGGKILYSLALTLDTIGRGAALFRLTGLAPGGPSPTRAATIHLQCAH